MFRMWAKIFKNNHMLKDTCIEDGSDDTRTHKVFHSLDEVCHQFDLGTPIWLDMNIADFKRHNKTRFTQDSFATVKIIFFGFDIDEQYAVSMAYRLVQGDRMFLEMWEPHQTSAFFSAAFLWLYMQLFHTLKYSVSFCES